MVISRTGGAIERRDDRGSALVLVLVLALGAGVVALAVVLVTAHTVQARARAQHAADAAALAALVDGEVGATRLADANGATIIWSSIDGDVARVEVEVHGVRARARAMRADHPAAAP